MVIDSKESRFKVACYLVLNFSPDRSTDLACYNARQILSLMLIFREPNLLS